MEGIARQDDVLASGKYDERKVLELELRRALMLLSTLLASPEEVAALVREAAPEVAVVLQGGAR